MWELMHLLLHMIFLWHISSAADWTPDNCPAACICHQIWEKDIKQRLNSVDCKGNIGSVTADKFMQLLNLSILVEREIRELSLLPNETQALLLSGNQYNLLSPEGNLSSILFLDISDNELKLHQIEQLKSFLTPMISLRKLDLSNNRLESLQGNPFAALKGLQFLSLKENDLVYIESDTFLPLINLVRLELTNNKLRQINGDWFSNNEKLRKLDLSLNKLPSLQKRDFLHLKNLSSINLSHNNISTIDSQLFPPESTIEELYLQFNQLQTFPPLSTSSLKILFLSGNPITFIKNNALTNQENLLHLALSDMPKLEMLDQDSLVNLPALRRIDLQQNKKMVHVHPQAFRNCTDVRQLFLHNSALKGLDETILDSLPSLSQLTMYNNPIHCNCQAEWLKKLANNTSNQLQLLDGNKIVCSTPAALKSLTLYSTDVTEKCEPIVIPLFNSSVTAEFSTNISLRCRAIGQGRMTWIYPTTSTRKTNNSLTEQGHLRLTTVNHNDQGLYTCMVTNDSGEKDSESVYIQVVHSVIALVPVLISNNFVALSWNQTSSETNSLQFHAVKSLEESKAILLPGQLNSFTVSNLQPDTEYIFCLQYHAGLEKTCTKAKTLPLHRDDIISTISGTMYSHESINNNLIIGLVTSCLLVIIGVILSILYKRFVKTKRLNYLYKKQRDEILMDTSFKLDQCYSPTTAPLCENEVEPC